MKSFFVRTVSGIVFVGIMAGCLLGGKISYACLMLFLQVSMLYEFYALTLGTGWRLQKGIGIAAGVCLWGATFLTTNGYPLTGAIAFLSIILLFWGSMFFIHRDKKEHTRPEAFGNISVFGKIMGGFLYISMPLTCVNFLAIVNEPGDAFSWSGYNGRFLLGLFIILWSSDVGAYIFGSLFGRHRLCPSISPKKTWEGAFGGLLTAAIAGYGLWYYTFFPCRWIHMAALVALVVVFGVLGDLLESRIKRSAGVKDSGKLMPGHGGILDRCDGMLLAFPAVLIYIFIIEILNIIW
ncbi:MAG: phosphatidate cytidylyltransferase [Prevotellaceae bacterium]|jgi:phosphatidate cytidylyltransferase|nr:phosphatidate cytidylyltransferase [Prevotellaceae bacterium]